MSNKNAHILTFPLGSPMNIMIRIMGVVMQLMGIYKFMELPLIATLIFGIGCFATYQWGGVEVNRCEHVFRSYTSILGIRRGEWIDLNKFPFVSVIKRSTSQRVYGQSMAGYDHTKQYYSVVLLNQSHRTKYVLKNVMGKEDAISAAERLASLLERELVNYSPTVARSSRARRKK